jgi:hypothetical protein
VTQVTVGGGCGKIEFLRLFTLAGARRAGSRRAPAVDRGGPAFERK